jgi:hypothetical protein
MGRRFPSPFLVSLPLDSILELSSEQSRVDDSLNFILEFAFDFDRRWRWYGATRNGVVLISFQQ